MPTSALPPPTERRTTKVRRGPSPKVNDSEGLGLRLEHPEKQGWYFMSPRLIFPTLNLTAGHSDGSYSGSLEEQSPARARYISLHKPGQGRIVHNASPRVSNTFNDIQSHSKADQILGVHAITMQALLRDEEALSDSSSKYSSLSSTARHSRNRSQSVPARKASAVLPPPIDTSAPGPLHLPPLHPHPLSLPSPQDLP